MKRPAVFFDRDNTLIVNDGYLGDPDGVVLMDGAADLVARVRRLGYAAVTFSNQSGVARGLFTEEDVHRVNSRLDEMLKDHEPDAVIDRHEFCPHHPEAAVPRYRQASEFRKPAPGMIYQAARQLGLDLSRSWVVGDAPRDVEAGRAAGCRTILFKPADHPASPAAREAPSVAPDFAAVSLRDVGDFIENNPFADEQVEPAMVIETSPIEAGTEAGSLADEVPVGQIVVESSLAAGMRLPEADVSHERAPSWEDRGLPTAAINDPVAEEPASGSEGQDQASPAAVSDASALEQRPPPQLADEEDMEDRSATGSDESSGADWDGAPRRRTPPAVILAAKAARAAARNSAPDASPEVLREVARNAAREAAMGITRDYPNAVQDQAPHDAGPAELSATVSDDEATAPRSQSAPQEPMSEPTTESPQYEEPVVPAHRAVADQPEEARPAPVQNIHRLEHIAEQILLELRQRNDAGADFSVSKLMAGITMVISLALLGYAYLYKNDPPTLQNLLLLGLMLQSITISLMIMGRQK